MKTVGGGVAHKRCSRCRLGCVGVRAQEGAVDLAGLGKPSVIAEEDRLDDVWERRIPLLARDDHCGD